MLFSHFFGTLLTLNGCFGRCDLTLTSNSNESEITLPPAATPRTSRSHNTSRQENPLRKSEAKQAIARSITTVKRISSTMRFGGTYAAFQTIISRLTALRSGVQSAKTRQDVRKQLTQADAYLKDALSMQAWSPNQFKLFYSRLGGFDSETLFPPKRRKVRTPPPVGGAPPKGGDVPATPAAPPPKSTSPEVKAIVAKVQAFPTDPLAFDPHSLKG